MKTNIFFIMGKSGSGKDTIVNLLLNLNKNIKKVIPITTRPPRIGEIDGKDYIFTTKDKIDSFNLLEKRRYEVINNDQKEDVWYYGHEIPKEEWSVMIGTPSLYFDLCEKLSFAKRDNPNLYNKINSIIPIYIAVQPDTRLIRLIKREIQNENPNIEELVRRYFKDEEDFKLIEYKDAEYLKSMDYTAIYENRDDPSKVALQLNDTIQNIINNPEIINKCIIKDNIISEIMYRFA